MLLTNTVLSNQSQRGIIGVREFLQKFQLLLLLFTLHKVVIDIVNGPSLLTINKLFLCNNDVPVDCGMLKQTV